MRLFTELYERLDRTTSTNAKVEALASYFRAAPPEDAAWALFLLTGRRIKRLMTSRVLWELVLDITRLPDWLVEHSYAQVGDAAEAMALLVDTGTRAQSALPLHRWIEERLLPLKQMDTSQQAEAVRAYWSELAPDQAFVLNKVITAEYRVGVSATLVVRALSQVAGVEPAVMAHRVMGSWEPTGAFFQGLLAADGGQADVARPYPFFLASPLEQPPETLGPREDWQAEWKWDGIRAQAVRRAGGVHVWSRGEDLVTDRFPELVDALRMLPDGVVVDGEVLAYRGEVLPFAVLQTRIGRSKITPAVLKRAPLAFMAYDLLEQDGVDLRGRPLQERRERLERLLDGVSPVLRVSPVVAASDWSGLAEVRNEARARNVEGLMLKRRSSPYQAGRRRGDWWKWKIDPYTVDAVLIYAHPGNGRRATLLTDYTFGIWDEGRLVTFAKAYSGLSDEEIRELDAWIRRHTLERHGPTRVVEPVQVFELGFEGIAPSSRHKSGVAVRFPRMLRWRKDKPASEADTLASLKALLPPA